MIAVLSFRANCVGQTYAAIMLLFLRYPFASNPESHRLFFAAFCLSSDSATLWRFTWTPMEENESSMLIKTARRGRMSAECSQSWYFLAEW